MTDIRRANRGLSLNRGSEAQVLTRLGQPDSHPAHILDRSGLEYHPIGMGLSKSDLKASLLNLKNFVSKKSEFWYTIINDAEINEDWVDDVLANLKF